MSEKIYSVKARNKNGTFTNRIKAESMGLATLQAMDELSKWGNDWNVQVTELKNQTLAMKQFNETQQSKQEA